jgi:acyl-CoA reductase-like NAD-dependent aldehyde dehydrogenase
LQVKSHIPGTDRAALFQCASTLGDVARADDARFLIDGEKAIVGSDIAGGFYMQPTLLHGSNDMRVFQEEIFGLTLGVTTFKDEVEALAIANATEYGLGAGVWTRDTNRAFRMGPTTCW